MRLSVQKEEIFSLKIEVDTNPPESAGLDTSVVRRHVMLQIQHHDRPSLLADKIHAVLQRPYSKGRDLYDLLWYLSDPEWPEPNIVLLNNALSQTEWSEPCLTEDNWKMMLGERIQGLGWENVKADVAPFLERSADLEMFTRENLLRVLNQD
jgi:hypothetical protein